MSDYRADWNSESAMWLFLSCGWVVMGATLWEEQCLRLGCLGMAAIFFPPTVLIQMKSSTRVKCSAHPCLTFQAHINKRRPLQLFCSLRASHESDTDEVTPTRPVEWTSLAGSLALQNFRTGFIRFIPGLIREQCTKGFGFTFSAPSYDNVTPPHMDACFWIHVS